MVDSLVVHTLIAQIAGDVLGQHPMHAWLILLVAAKGHTTLEVYDKWLTSLMTADDDFSSSNCCFSFLLSSE